MFVFLFQFFAVLLVGAVFLVLKEKAFAELVALGVGELLEGREVGLVVLHDGLVDDLVLYLRGCLAALEDEEDERLEEVLLLAEVLGVLGVRYLERVHRNGLFLGVGDVSAFEIAAYTLVAVAGIDHDHVGVLLQELADDAVHVEVFSGFVNNCNTDRNITLPKLNGTKKCNSENWEIEEFCRAKPAFKSGQDLIIC